MPSLKDEPRCSALRRFADFGLLLRVLPDVGAVAVVGDVVFLCCAALFFGDVTCARVLLGESGASSRDERDVDGVRRIIFRFNSSLNELAFFSTPAKRKKICLEMSNCNALQPYKRT